MHADCRGREWVGGGKEQRSPVLPVGVGSVGWAGQDVVPF